jgi:hypothetical protein
LCLHADCGQRLAVPQDHFSDLRQVVFKFCGGGERRQRVFVTAASGNRLVAADDDALLRLVKSGYARRMAIDVAFCRSMIFASRIQRFLSFAPGRARLGLGGACGGEGSLRGVTELTLGLDFSARVGDLTFNGL